MGSGEEEEKTCRWQSPPAWHPAMSGLKEEEKKDPLCRCATPFPSPKEEARGRREEGMKMGLGMMGGVVDACGECDSDGGD